MATTLTKRFEARLDDATDELITKAAELTHMSKSAFVTSAARAEAEKIVARADITMLDSKTFDQLVSSLDVADESPELAKKLGQLPRIA
jgi:uncharacterized protein (DUF1778 family)